MRVGPNRLPASRLVGVQLPGNRHRPSYKPTPGTYSASMVTLTASDARTNFASTVRRSRSEPVVIEKRGVREAVILSPELFDRLVDAQEELEDISAFDASMAEEGDNIPWEEVKAELGWV